MNRKNIKLFLIPAIFFAVFLGFGNEANAATNWYVSPTSSANCASGCLTGAPCSLATVLTCNVVGDGNVILKDGTYTGTSLTVPWSGTEGHPITIKAENDGQAIVNGGYTLYPLYISAKSYIDIEGIVFKNGIKHVVNISNSDHISLKKVSAYNANENDNSFQFSVYVSNYILLEDCAGSGTGRKPFNIYASSYVTLRRCWGRNLEWPGSDGNSGNAITLYGTSDSILENCVFTIAPSTTNVNAGVSVFAHEYNPTGSNRNKIYGNIIYGYPLGYGFQDNSNVYRQTDNIFKDNVSINNDYGMRNSGDANATFQNNTIVNTSNSGLSIYEMTIYTKASDFWIQTVLKNSAFIIAPTGLSYSANTHVGLFTHTYNKFFNVSTLYYGTTAGTGESTLETNPYSDNYIAYGKGAYLMIPTALQGQGEGGADIGAEVLYRYVDGVITETPLWPWPMESRIKNETGYSVTYENAGGIWKTLDGVYSQQPDTAPPSTPTGVVVQ